MRYLMAQNSDEVRKVGLDKCRDVESSLAGSGDITLKGNITGRLNKAKAGSGDYIIELRK